MPSPRNPLIPSMFRRRLWLLASLTIAVIGMLALQMARLTVVQGADWRERAEAALSERRLIATKRGSILDRKGRPLAVDKACFDVAVRYQVISGDWAPLAARAAARKATDKTWYEMSPADREAATHRLQPVYEAQVAQLWDTLCATGGLERGELEEHRQRVLRRVQQVANDVWLRRMQQRLLETDETPTLEQVNQPIGEQQAAHALVNDVDEEGRLTLEKLIAQAAVPDADPRLAVWRQVSIIPSKHREYPLETMHLMIERESLPSPLRQQNPLEVKVEGAGLHIIGALKPITSEDYEKGRCPRYRVKNTQGCVVINLAGYLPGELIGCWGIERSQEQALRGSRGVAIDYLDTGTHEQQDPRPGEDIQLSIDIQLQARVQAIMSPAIGLMTEQAWYRKQTEDEKDPRPKTGDALNGAAVVLDVPTGQVLAAVSVPSFGLRQLHEASDSVWNDPINHPEIFRPVGMAYEPGSIVKPLVTCAAITEGRVTPQETINCQGVLDPHNPGQLGCWIFRQWHQEHGPLSAHEAIARSCNIFFYTMARRLGPLEMTRWYGRFGLGRYLLGTGPDGELREEVCGILPSATRMAAPGFAGGEGTLMGIGQGPIDLTPLQIANAYAAIGRGGYLLRPTFLMPSAGHPREGMGEDLGLNPAGVQTALQGLDEAVNASFGGAGHIAPLKEKIFNLPGVKIIGKSGTADAPPLRVDGDGDRRITAQDPVVRAGAHAWFVALVYKPGSTRPDYVVAVVVEYAGSGATIAGPIVNQILHALRTEGYL